MCKNNIVDFVRLRIFLDAWVPWDYIYIYLPLLVIYTNWFRCSELQSNFTVKLSPSTLYFLTCAFCLFSFFRPTTLYPSSPVWLVYSSYDRSVVGILMPPKLSKLRNQIKYQCHTFSYIEVEAYSHYMGLWTFILCIGVLSGWFGFAIWSATNGF